ncbi:transglycosylase domain-containing protein, partial [Escherichia coli]|nr:transglycosylase domain-containing protein [Escherichia coli]
IKEATLAVEDKRFYDHNGFDIKRIGGAIVADIKAMSKVQGASTITQQYARNLFLEHDKTWTRKFQEALYTIRLEFNYDKDKIFEGYLNTIYYG